MFDTTRYRGMGLEGGRRELCIDPKKCTKKGSTNQGVFTVGFRLNGDHGGCKWLIKASVNAGYSYSLQFAESMILRIFQKGHPPETGNCWHSWIAPVKRHCFKGLGLINVDVLADMVSPAHFPGKLPKMIGYQIFIYNYRCVAYL